MYNSIMMNINATMDRKVIRKRNRRHSNTENLFIEKVSFFIAQMRSEV